ncbi:MAG: A24 family peptidase C-terminal domain-containing protein [Nitrosotalea sp.]
MDGIHGLNEIRIIVALSMLFLATIIDIRKREINDILWIGFGGIAVLLFFLNGELWQTFVLLAISMIISPIVLLIWRLGVFGGADALCLIVLAALAPMATFGTLQITPFTTLTNAAIISIAPIFVNILRNLIAILRRDDIFEGLDISRLHKAMAFCIGYKARNSKYSFSIERMEGTRKKLDFSFKHAEKTSFSTTSDTWVTPSIPYVLYITTGFIIQILYGDMIFNTMHIIK